MILQTLAEDTFQELGYPSGITVCYISGWYVTNIGKLNNRLGTCFSGLNECIDPPLDAQAQPIYKELFFEKFYAQRTAETLMEARYGTIQSVMDEDTKITWSDRTQLTKQYNELMKQSRANIKEMAFLYRANAASPRQVIGDDANPDDTEVVS